jgi:hypothetical protein
LQCFPRVVPAPPTNPFTALSAYSAQVERSSSISQAVIRQILTAGIGVFSREHQVILVVVKMAETGSSSSASLPIINHHNADVPHSPVILRTDIGFLSGRKPKTPQYQVVIRQHGRSSGPASQLPVRRITTGAIKSPGRVEIWCWYS